MIVWVSMLGAIDQYVSSIWGLLDKLDMHISFIIYHYLVDVKMAGLIDIGFSK